MGRLTNRLNRDSEPWRPNPGDTIEGEVVELDTRDGGYGPYPIVTVVTDDDREVTVHCFHEALRGQVESKNVAVGDTIGVIYRGKTTSANGRSFHSYRLIVDRSTSTPVTTNTTTTNTTTNDDIDIDGLLFPPDDAA